MSIVLAERPEARIQAFTDDQRRMIRDAFANGATDAEFAVLMEIACARRLNPLLRQVHFVSRWDSHKRREVWAVQVSIDGLRAIAERTGLYAGQDEPEFVDNPDGTPKLCRVRVYRKDWPRPAVGIAYWEEYVQTTRDKATGKTRPSAMWERMPHVMLAKCAESLALRKAFPEDMSGLYTSEEMAQATNAAPLPEVDTELTRWLDVVASGSWSVTSAAEWWVTHKADVGEHASTVWHALAHAIDDDPETAAQTAREVKAACKAAQSPAAFALPEAAPRWASVTTSAGVVIESESEARSHLAKLNGFGLRASFARHAEPGWRDLCAQVYADKVGKTVADARRVLDAEAARAERAARDKATAEKVSEVA